MNSKIIAAGVVVALCAVALIGVGYAYTATVTSEDNTFGSKYITIQAGDNAETVWNDVKFNYDTSTTASGVTFTSTKTEVVGSEIIKVNKRDTTVSAVTLSVSIPLSIFGDPASAYQDLFYQPAVKDSGGQIITSSKNATMTFVYNTSTKITSEFTYDDAGGKMVWTFLGVPVDTELTVKLECLDGASISIDYDENSPVNITGPSIDIDFTFKAESPTTPAP